MKMVVNLNVIALCLEKHLQV